MSNWFINAELMYNEPINTNSQREMMKKLFSTLASDAHVPIKL